MKKILTGLFILIVVAFLGFHYYLNFQTRVQPPSEKWAKEVEISKGHITTFPQIIKLNSNFIVAHVDGNNIKILEVDKFGEKLKEKSFRGEYKEPYNVNVVTDGENIYLSWEVIEKTKKNVVNLKLDKNFNLLEKSYINGISEKIQVGNDMLVILYYENIEAYDYRTGKKLDIPVKFASLLTGTKVNDSYVIAYQGDNGGYETITIKDDVVTGPTLVGRMVETGKVNFFNTAFVTDGINGYVLGEYKYMDQFAGARLLQYNISTKFYKHGDLKQNGKNSFVANVTAGSSKGDGKFVASAERLYGKKEVYTDIIELAIKNGEVSGGTPISRTKALSGYPAVCEDVVIFCDFQANNETALLMTSTNEDFKRLHNGIRSDEYKAAIIDTTEGAFAAIAYFFTYGILWLIPSLCLVSLVCLFEFKLKARAKKIAFILCYVAATAIKLVAIKSVSFTRYKHYLPDFITLPVGFSVAIAIGILCSIYGYRNYARDMEKNVIALSFSPAIFIDTMLTQLFFVPFII